MNIENYIIKNANNLFEHDLGRPIHVDVQQKKHTSFISCCNVYFESGLTRKILIKSYDDNIKTRKDSLHKEFTWSRINYRRFISEDIGIPKPIYFDAENEILVMEYVDHSKSLEDTLLNKRNILKTADLKPLFFNAGKWLARFHAINLISREYELNGQRLSNEIKDKWIQSFNVQNKIQNDINYHISPVNSNIYAIGSSGLHKEYAPGNIIHVNNKVYGVDLGSRERGCVLDDIAYFIIATLVLNPFPRYPFYKRIDFKSEDLQSFYDGYSFEYELQDGIFSSDLFAFFLYKNLIRRISGQLRKADRYPGYIRYLIKIHIYKVYQKIKKNIFPYFNRT